jgi:hypothetical protein
MTIQTLETKLAHERIGKDEALRRFADELAAERTARQQAEQDRDKAIAALPDAEARLRTAMAVQEAQMLSNGPVSAKGARKAGRVKPRIGRWRFPTPCCRMTRGR